MYAIGFFNAGNAGFYPVMGNNGLKKLHNNTINCFKKEFRYVLAACDIVFVVSDFTQKMCEMNAGKLFDHCLRNNITILK